jgi:hypothetical protein
MRAMLWIGVLLSFALSRTEALHGADPPAPRGYEATAQDGWWFAAPRGSAGPEPRFAAMVTERLAAMRRRLGRSAASEAGPGLRESRPPVLLVRAADRGEFRRVTIELGGGDPEEWVSALAFPGRGIVVLDAARLAALPLARGEVVIHELAHVVLGEGGPNVPRWYHEGVAQWLAGERLEMEWLDLLCALAAEDGLIPFAGLDRFLSESQRQTSVLYAQSHHFVLTVNERFGEGVHAEILDRLAAGEPFAAAFRGATGSDLGVIEREWAAALAARHRWWSVLAQGTLFQALAIVAVIAYFLERGRRRRALARMPEDPGDEGSAPETSGAPGVASPARGLDL